MSTVLSVAEYVTIMGSTGTVPAGAAQLAIDIAEGDVSAALGFPIDEATGAPTFIESTWIEQHKWPVPNRPLQLRRPRVISLTTVTALHDITCDCEWTEVTECGFIYDAKEGIVKFKVCNRAANCWTSCSCPTRIQVTYLAGFTAAQVADGTPLHSRLQLAIALQATDQMQLFDHYTDGGVTVKSYSSLGYSETRELALTARGKKMGMGMLNQRAASLLNPLITRGAIMLRSQ